MTNILKAIINIVNSPVHNLTAHYSVGNRAVAMGASLETYVKDAFAGTINVADHALKIQTYHQYFSYLGNTTNPPDLMLRGGDAIEVKKIQNGNSALELNSSHPKDKLHSNSALINRECRICEDWTEKDIIYAVGNVVREQLKFLWMVYGDCYAANQDVYLNLKSRIAEGISEIPGIEFSPTRELGRVNRVDQLGITCLRIRGMWLLENPSVVFRFLHAINPRHEFTLAVLMKEIKYNSFPIADINALNENQSIEVNDVQVSDPNNPANLLNCKLITFVS